ncbi:transcriptional regulator [Streptomyces sp. NPDC056470]|uniref:transcriptional regulator n=1 Tax=Streptomyces sp. NPDC056470 TaxID=3345831 RepID=UPI00369E66EE
MPRRNTVLEALLVEYGLTHEQLALDVNRVSLELLGKPGDCTDRHVRRWISGEVQWPWTRYLLPLAEIFGRPPQAMGFVPRGKNSTNLPAPPRPATGREEPSVHRRRFVTASTAATVSTALGLHHVPTRGRITMSDVGRVEEQIARLDQHFFAIGGGAVLAVATSYIERLTTTLNNASYGERIERALHGAISSLHSSAGWAAHDYDDTRQAGLHYAAALQNAMLSGDASAIARAWSNVAMHARIEGRHRQAVQLSRAALDDRRARHDARISALLHCRLAVGQARTGDPKGAARSLLAAEKAYDGVSGPAPAWLAFLTPAEISGLTAIALDALGDHARSAAATRQAIELLPVSMRRSRTFYGVQLAKLQLDLGEREQAAATVQTIDSSNLDSRRITTRLAAVQRTLGEHR